MALFLAATFYGASVVAGYVVEIGFGLLHLIPAERHAQVQMAHVSWNYTTFLNIAFLILAAALVFRFVRTGGREMLSMMGGSPDSSDATARAERGGSGSRESLTMSCTVRPSSRRMSGRTSCWARSASRALPSGLAPAASKRSRRSKRR